MNKLVWSHEKFAIDENMVWFVPYYSSVLCGFDLDKREIVKVKMLDGEGDRRDGYLNVLKVGNYIVLIPSYGEKFIIYHIVDENTYTYTPSESSTGKYFQAVVVGAKIVVLPIGAESVVEITIDGDEEPRFKEIPTKVNGFVGSALFGEKIYCVKRDDGLYEYESNGTFTKVKMVDGKVFTDIACVNNNEMFVLDAEGDIYIYSGKDKTFTQWLSLDYSCHSMAVSNNRMFVFPEKDATFIDAISIETGKRSRQELDIEMPMQEWNLHFFSKAVFSRGKVFAMSPKIQSLVEIDSVTNAVSLYYMEFPELAYEEKMKLLKDGLKIGAVIESIVTDVDLSFYISALPYI